MGKHATKKIHATNGILFVDFEFVGPRLKVNEIGRGFLRKDK